jgi:hypothetical protein
VLTILVVVVSPSPARADGDPASDVLVNQSLFLPADAAAPVPAQLRLVSVLDAARRAGLPIRVAIISSRSDMGSVSALWDQPRAYTRSLGFELSLTGRERLLVVMPNGVGFYETGHSAAAIDDRVGRIHVGRGGSALLGEAQAAVLSVADAAHERLAPPGRGADPRVGAPTLWRPTTQRVFGSAILAALLAQRAPAWPSPAGAPAIAVTDPCLLRTIGQQHVSLDRRALAYVRSAVAAGHHNRSTARAYFA